MEKLEIVIEHHTGAEIARWIGEFIDSASITDPQIEKMKHCDEITFQVKVSISGDGFLLKMGREFCNTDYHRDIFVTEDTEDYGDG